VVASAAIFMFTVKVVAKKSGKPVERKRVSASFNGFIGGSTGSKYTDSLGEAHFTNQPGIGKVYVDGQPLFEGRIEGRVVIYI
jgi:hypothetical protein